VTLATVAALRKVIGVETNPPCEWVETLPLEPNPRPRAAALRAFSSAVAGEAAWGPLPWVEGLLAPPALVALERPSPAALLLGGVANAEASAARWSCSCRRS
jgi:hypothetical protein